MTAGIDKTRLPLIIAHRGASYDAPENTIAAFKLAWKQGADAVEGDFRMTSDGMIVCFHDPHARFSDGTVRKISEVTRRDLKHIEYSAATGQRSGKSIPTIADVFGQINEDKHLFIEVKCGPEIIPVLLEEIRSADISQDQVTIISFYPEVISKLKELSPGIRAHWLVKFQRNKLRLTPNAHQILKILRQLNADGVGAQACRKLTKSFVSTIKDAGFGFHVWTVDSPSLARKLAQLGVDSITTNKPQALRLYLLKSLSPK